jgi:DNA-binding NarL/FixJ family response regulator
MLLRTLHKDVAYARSGYPREGNSVNTEVKKAVRTILVDDYPPFLAALAALLRSKPGIEVVGRAYNGMEGLELAATSKPDLVLVDFNMPDMDGLAVARRLKAGAEPPRVVVMSFHAEPEYRDMALKAGADGYLIKAEINQELMPLLERIAG